jgi:hypothetical protein
MGFLARLSFFFLDDAGERLFETKHIANVAALRTAGALGSLAACAAGMLVRVETGHCPHFMQPLLTGH